MRHPGTWLQIMVRLKPGQSLEQANAALRTVQPQIVETATISRQRSEPLTLVSAANGNSSLRTRFQTPLFAMVVGVGLVLLVACANIASLLLAWCQPVAPHGSIRRRCCAKGSDGSPSRPTSEICRQISDML
jgi:hypothetical protein